MKRKDIFRGTEHIHFIGIGGSGMCGIAEVILNLGYRVSGSDLKDTEVTKRLRGLGAKIYIGHRKENIKDVDVVVYSSAVKEDNPELLYARLNKIPTIPRAEMLAEIMKLKRGIAIAGTHGKTTTTSLVGSILNYAGYNPTIVVGGKLFSINSNAKLGKGEFLVCEADESDGSFLKLSPEYVIVTNIDNDHLDYYKNFENLKNSFKDFINKVPFYSKAVVCIDDKNINSILDKVYKRVISYGIKNSADFSAKEIKFFKDWTEFDIYRGEKRLGNIKTFLKGYHNILNILGASALAIEVGVEFNKIKEAVKNFSGVERRLQLIGEKRGIKVYDDYGHHPTEIKNTLQAIRKNFNGNLIVIFQPHRYTRTKILYKDFGKCFNDADFLFITDIYPAGEKPIKGVTGKLIYDSVRKFKKNVKYIPDKKDALEEVLKICKEGDIILTLGAGDIKNLAPIIVERLGR
jgi:UDP-N-acetylmuramate--alanine ligase